MPSRIFEYTYDEEFGSHGLRMINMPHFNVGDGLTCTHDLLEHFPNDKGEVEDELMALGASLHVRDNDSFGNCSGNRYSAAENLSSDLANLGNYLNGRSLLMAPPKARRLNNCDEGIEQTIQEAVRLAKIEIDAMDLYDTEWFDRKKLEGWLRHGYRRARRRYPTPSWHMCGFFMHVRDRIDQVAKYMDLGQRIKVTAYPAYNKLFISDPYWEY